MITFKRLLFFSGVLLLAGLEILRAITLIKYSIVEGTKIMWVSRLAIAVLLLLISVLGYHMMRNKTIGKVTFYIFAALYTAQVIYAAYIILIQYQFLWPQKP